MLVFLLFLAGHDSSSIRLRDKFVDALTLKRIKRWHRDGTIIYGMFCIAISYHVSLFLLIPAILIRLAFFDPALNYWTDFNPGFIGTTAFWDKKFARIFGKNGAIRKAIVFLLLLIVLNILFINKIIAQTFLGMGITSHGICVGGGYMFKEGKLKNYQLEFDYRCPLKRSDVPNTSSLLIGRNIEYSKYNLNLATGVGYYRVQKFYKYNYLNHFTIEQVTKLKPSFKLELSRHISDGLLYTSFNYCGLNWYSLGFKTILSNIK